MTYWLQQHSDKHQGIPYKNGLLTAELKKFGETSLLVESKIVFVTKPLIFYIELFQSKLLVTISHAFIFFF